LIRITGPACESIYVESYLFIHFNEPHQELPKITDPARGQQVTVGKNLTLSGTASYNATSNCGVFVIVDGIRPYQKTTPIGQTRENDYYKWKYTFALAYTGTIIEGINRITAKLLCQVPQT